MDENSPQQNQAPQRAPLQRPVRTYQEQVPERKHRITLTMAALLIVTALSIDAFQAILNVLIIGEALSPVISICADVIFMIWFWMLGISLMENPRALIVMASQAIIGLIPALDTLPELTLGIIGVIIFTRIVDKSAIAGKVANTLQGKIK